MAERTQIEQAELVARLERRAVALLETWVTQQARCLALCDVIHAIAVVQGRSAEDPSPSATEDGGAVWQIRGHNLTSDSPLACGGLSGGVEPGAFRWEEGGTSATATAR